MYFLDTISPAEADGAVAAMYRRQQAAWGFVPNYARVFCHRPEVMARWAQLLAEIKRPMDARRFELATFGAAHELRNSACTLAHGAKLRAFFSDADILALARDEPSAGVGAADLAIVRFARQVAREASRVTRADVDSLRSLGLSDAEVFDVAAAAAARSFFAKLLDALGVQADSPILALEPALRQALTVGRPIDRAACVVME